MSHGANNVWGGERDLLDSVGGSATGDLFDIVEESNNLVGPTVEYVVSQSDEILEDKNNIEPSKSQPELKPIICHCGSTMIGVGEGAHCPNGHRFLDKPIHDLGFGTSKHNFLDRKNDAYSEKNKISNSSVGVDKFVPIPRKLFASHNASTNSFSSDGEVYLNGFERKGSTIIFNISIQQRSEKYKRLHVGRRKGPTGKYDGEEVRTEKIVTKSFKKDIRIHLGPHPEKPGFKRITGVYSGVKSNGKPYIKKDGKWFPETLPTSESGKRTWQPLDHASIRKISIECADIYIKHMRQ